MQYEYIFNLSILRKSVTVLIWLVFANFFISCQSQNIREVSSEVPKDWQKIETDYFSFSIPPTMKKNEVHGTDSQLMQFENSQMILEIDYGMYSTSIDNSIKYFEGEKESIKIDVTETELISFDRNKPIVSPDIVVNADGSTKFEKVKKNYVVGVNFPYESKPILSKSAFAASFIADCNSLEARETAKIILYSIKFKQN